MSINKKAFYLLTILIISLLLVQGMLFTLLQLKTDSQIENKEMQINKNIEKEVENRLKETINNIAMNVVVLEEEIDKNMLNAAYLLQNIDQKEKITDEQLKQITTITQMSDLYLTDENGVFTQSTEEKAIGISLYSIWDGYKMLMTGESTYLPSTIKIKEETGEIFKFTAIPRFDSKGIIETALNAKIFEENLKRSITKENGIQSLYLIDGSGLVLTESVKDEKKSKWKIGQSIKDEKIGKIIQTKKTTIEMKNGQAEIYAPIIKNNQVIYVLYSVVETENYFSNAKIMKQSLWDMKLQIKSNTYLIIVILFVLSIVVLFILSILIKKFVEPLVKMSEITKKLSLGDLTVEKINLNNKDEIGTLAKTFNHMISALREAFSKMDTNAKQLSSFSEQVSASTESNKYATNQITIIMQEAANGAIVQAKKSEESRQLTNETNLFNSLIKKKCENVLSSSTQTEKEAKTGNEIVKKTMEQIKVLNESVEKVNCVTHRLNQRSKEIELIIETINNIASQTELLALNAGIEAARSGEQGKGFAVIAHEVKKLADDSKKSTIQISTLIKEIQKDTSEAVNTMDIHTEEMKMGTRLINQSGVIFENIVNEVENITQQIKEVSSTSEKMTEIVEKVNDSVSNIHDIANESSEKFNNVVAGTEEQLSVMEEIYYSMKHLKEMANELEAVISKYKY